MTTPEIIDAHQHFWQLARGDYDWPNDTVAPIFRDFQPDDMRPLLRAAGVTQTILVQATDSVAETEYLLDLAAKTDFVAGVVGWVDVAAPDAVATIDQLCQNHLLKGLRPMLQGIEATDWILQDAARPALAHMAHVGLAFDALIQPRHLPVIAELAAQHPDLRIVIDHIAKPQMGAGQLPTEAFVMGMQSLATQPNVACKLSGMVTEAGDIWDFADLTLFAQIVLNVFGPGRLMFGSDWPVINLASDYASWIAFVRDFLAPLSPDAQHRVLAGNAATFYRI